MTENHELERVPIPSDIKFIKKSQLYYLFRNRLSRGSILTKRSSAVAGMFYPDNPRELRGLVDQSFRNQRFGPGRAPPSAGKRRIYGIVSPHAGYAYSGAVAANGFYEVSSMDFHDVIMVGPN